MNDIPSSGGGHSAVVVFRQIPTWASAPASWRRLLALVGPVLLFAAALSSNVCLAGPPFFTDDPVPVDTGRWEINNYSSGTFATGAFAGVLPGMDANYGAIQNVQLHLLVPFALAQSSGMNTQWGLGDVEIGEIPLPSRYREGLVAADRFLSVLGFPDGQCRARAGDGRHPLVLANMAAKGFRQMVHLWRRRLLDQSRSGK